MQLIAVCSLSIRAHANCLVNIISVPIMCVCVCGVCQTRQMKLTMRSNWLRDRSRIHVAKSMDATDHLCVDSGNF